MRRCNTEGEKKKKRLSIAAVLTALVLLAFAGGTAARYVLQKQTSGIAEAKAFYFTSDLLKEESENAEYYIDLKEGTFTFTLSNSADSERISSMDIKYNVTVNSNGTGGSEDTVTPADGTLTGAAGTGGKAVITVTPKTDANMVTVTAVSQLPYKKTLKAVFHLNPGRYFEVEDKKGNTAAVLTIRMGQAAADSNITITLPPGVIPDATDSRVTVAADGTGNTYTLQLSESGVYSLVLLKTDTTATLNKNSTPFTGAIDLTNQAK